MSNDRFGFAVLSQTLPSPDYIKKHGILVPVELSLPVSRTQEMEDQDVETPEPLAGHLLLDTGAAGSTVSEDALQRINAHSTGMILRQGVNGRMMVPSHIIRLGFTAVENDRPRRVHIETNVTPMSECPDGAIGLLGRDVLRYTRFLYDGIKGLYQIEFTLDHMDPVPTLPLFE